MFPDLDILKHPEAASKITIIEGPDSSGKSTLIKEIEDVFRSTQYDLRVIRLPDNHGSLLRFRDILFSQEVKNNPSCQTYLFLAEMLYVFESQIKPYLKDDKVKFLFDRFLPSTIIYQKKTLSDLEVLFDPYNDFKDCFKEAHYIYLSPQSFEDHKRRILKKRGDKDINHFDPISDDDIKENTRDYYELSRLHKRIGLLGSKYVSTHIV